MSESPEISAQTAPENEFKFNLGTLKSPSTISRQAKFFNSSSSEFSISEMRTSCGCLEVASKELSIPAKTESEIELIMRIQQPAGIFQQAVNLFKLQSGHRVPLGTVYVSACIEGVWLQPKAVFANDKEGAYFAVCGTNPVEVTEADIMSPDSIKLEQVPNSESALRKCGIKQSTVKAHDLITRIYVVKNNSGTSDGGQQAVSIRHSDSDGNENTIRLPVSLR